MDRPANAALVTSSCQASAIVLPTTCLVAVQIVNGQAVAGASCLSRSNGVCAAAIIAGGGRAADAAGGGRVEVTY